MKLAVLHRRLVAGMGLAALLAFAAGAGFGPGVLFGAAGLGLSLFWLPSEALSRWLERAARVGILALFGWMLYVAFVVAGDFMPAVLAMLLFLLVTESLRSLDARNDMRLYSLSFALLIAATAYYPGLGFAVGFVAYVALATLGMMVGFLRRQTEQLRVATPRVGRRFLLTTAALSGVTLMMSGVLFVFFPRLPRQWNVQGRRGAGEVMAGFGDQVSLGEHGRRISPNPEVAFRVEFPEGRPLDAEELYWRGRSFDHFDGVQWSRTRGIPAAGLSRQGYAVRWGGPFRRFRVFGGPPGAEVLFGPHPVLDVRPRSAIRAFTDPTGDVVFFGSDMPVYVVTSASPRPADADLRAAAQPEFLDLDAYLQLPDLSPRIRRLADSLAAGRADRLDAVRAVEAYFEDGFGYTLDLPRTARDASLDAFLFRRREGHCEYFSTAMAVLLRAQGIPARNVTGFLGGEWNQFGEYLAVTGNEAHSWVEAWFPGYGWVTFDPTPSGRAGVVDEGAGGWTWPARFWLDGLEHRWYKWVIDYNLDRQLEVFRGVSRMFSAGPGRSEPGGGGGGALPRGALPWALGAGAVLLFWLLARSAPGARPAPASRAYLALRRAYERAGRMPPRAAAPLELARALERESAPGAEEAARVVDLYVRARFSGDEMKGEELREMEDGVAEVRRALRAAGRRPRPKTPA